MHTTKVEVPSKRWLVLLLLIICKVRVPEISPFITDTPNSYTNHEFHCTETIHMHSPRCLQGEATFCMARIVAKMDIHAQKPISMQTALVSYKQGFGKAHEF